jgi:hypothetical protein
MYYDLPEGKKEDEDEGSDNKHFSSLENYDYIIGD